MKLPFLFFLLVSLCACDNVQRLAKRNALLSPELSKVIDHYSQNKGDSLKLEAAYYLINNMKVHYSNNLVGVFQEKYTNAFHSIDSVMQNLAFSGSTNQEVLLSLISLDTIKHRIYNNSEVYDSLTIYPDINQMNGNWLIDHIDRSFSVWMTSEFSRSLTKKEFFESVLPYRVENEPLNSDISFHELYYPLFNNDSTLINSGQLVNKLNKYLNGFFNCKQRGILDSTVDFTYIMHYWFGDCVKESIFATKILRAAGIPAFVEFTPQWKASIANRRHYWCSVKDGENRFAAFTPHYQAINTEETKIWLSNASKVFRFTFEINYDSPFFLKRKNEYIPPELSSPNIIDVTDNYFKVLDITVDIPDFPNKSTLCYLAIFNAPDWCPVDFAVYQKKTRNATFRKIQSDCVYAVICYSGEKRESIEILSKPFYITGNGDIRYIEADFTHKTHQKLIEKHPQKYGISQNFKDLIGSKFQGANNPDFSDAVDFYTFTEEPLPIIYSFPTNNSKKFRYARLTNKMNKKALWVAHMEFHSDREIPGKTTQGMFPFLLEEVSKDSIDRLNKKTKLEGTLHPLAYEWKEAPDDLRIKGIDGDIETYSLAHEIAFDFGYPVVIESIRYISRNANNWVVIGDHYVLQYFNKGWFVHDTVQAKYSFVEFENVPSKTLYWLRNIDHGIEEHVFMYHNEKQYFVNRDDLSGLF